MKSFKLFKNTSSEQFKDDELLGVIRLHGEMKAGLKKLSNLKRNQLLVVYHNNKKTYGILRFIVGVEAFHKNSIKLCWDQREDLGLDKNDDAELQLILKKGNLFDAMRFAWCHANPTVRYPFKIAAILGIISFIVSLISLFFI